MTEIILVRHGQANYVANDEASYVKLSDLGWQQSQWLGQHFSATNPQFDLVVTGTLRRQTETARGLGQTVTRQDTRLNEMQYFDLTQALKNQFDVAAPQGASDFATHLPMIIDHWQRDLLADIPEPFERFAGRTMELVNEVCGAHGRALLVTSGGVIGVIMRHVLALDNAATSSIMLQVMNSSVHRLHYVHGHLMLGTFNATPHLDTPERAHARTYV